MSEATRALAGARTMSELIPPLQATRGVTTWVPNNGWTTRSGSNSIMWESYIDMDGFTRDGMTCFPSGATIQDPGDYLSSNAETRVNIMDIISTDRLPLVYVNNWLETDFAVPGMSPTDVDWSQVVWGQWRSMMPQATFQGNGNVLLVSNGQPFGSGEPTTARKLWCYRFIWLYGSQQDDTVIVPASRMILSAVMAQEGEKEFLMRQKRSYELEQDF